MRAPLLLIIFFITTLVFGGAHLLASKFFLYWKYTWLDIPMHILGGIIVVFAFLLALKYLVRLPRRYSSLLPTLATVLFIGLLWELFEIKIGIPLYEENFEIDLAGDLLMDIVGGVIGYYVGSRLSTLE